MVQPVSLAQLNVPAVEKFCKLYESQELALVSRALREHEQSQDEGQVRQHQHQRKHQPPVKGPDAPTVRSTKDEQGIQASPITEQTDNQASIAKLAAADPLPAVATWNLPTNVALIDQDLLWWQLPVRSMATSSQCSSEGAMHAQLLRSAAAGSPAIAAVQAARQGIQQHAGHLQGQFAGRTAASAQQCQQQQLEAQVAAAFAQQFAALPSADACSGPVHPVVIQLFVTAAASASLQSCISS
jgi:hypothetical protein